MSFISRLKPFLDHCVVIYQGEVQISGFITHVDKECVELQQHDDEGLPTNIRLIKLETVTDALLRSEELEKCELQVRLADKVEFLPDSDNDAFYDGDE